VRTRQAVCSAFAAVCAAALMAQGCGSKKEDLTPSSWANPQYRISATHPAVWAVKDFNTVEDPKTGAVLLAIFRKVSDIDKEVRESPPMVKVVWIPRRQTASEPVVPPESGVPDMTRGPHGIPVMDTGITAGWTEFGAQDIQTKQITWAGNIPAEEATALANPGTAFLATIAGGQLAGLAQHVRVVALKLPTGTFEITRVAAPDTEGLVEQADQIVDSIRLAQ